ncbi:MAG: SDR family NAD(P)-dependent oxidoreductase [Desulfobacteraceae bacterium]|nr:SDR family NAD(P)-dependent oxidoreductase [Desulfobacteraceae bacterium]
MAVNDFSEYSLPDLILDELCAANDETDICYASEKRWVKCAREYAPDILLQESLPLKEDGVYLITGGAGSIGLIFAAYLAEKLNKTKIVLTGRSDLSPGKAAKIKELESRQTQAVYIKTDISEQEDVNRLASEISSRFGKINGIIHSAGIIRDNFIVKKTRAEMAAVFAPKVYGTLYLDETFKEENLDFFVMFSSMAGVTGNPGQSDYAFANSFMDSFASVREILRSEGKRKGKTVSVRWPLWKQGGMKTDEKTELLIKKRTGMIPIEKADGLRTFETALLSDTDQLGVFKGEKEKISSVMELRPSVKSDDIDMMTQAEAEKILETELDELEELIETEI